MIRERFNAGGVIAGLIFIVLGAALLLEQLDVWELRLQVVLPAFLVGVGVLIVLGALLGRAYARRIAGSVLGLCFLA